MGKLITYIAAVLFSTFLMGFSSCTKNKETLLKPNIIFVMADDLGYGDIGCYGQKEIKTPYIDNLANEGIRFTEFYSGSPVCAPARSVLMTGMHTGRTTVRGNFGKSGVIGLGGSAGRVPLKEEDVTIGEILKDAGYVTGMTGKWGLGEPETSGLPNEQGFDEWFGFLNQKRAHNHYADYIWHNKEKFPIPENSGGEKGRYTHEMFTDFALDFIKKNAGGKQPFFLYIPYLLPHSDFEIPEINSLYADKEWPHQEKVYASMVSMIDADMGKIQAALKENNILRNTILIFTSDNGAAYRFEDSINSSGNLKGRKRDVYEGGIKVPLIVSMPGTVPEGKVNHSIGYFADVLPTLVHVCGQPIPHDIDGISLKDAFLNNIQMDEDRALYWEFHEEGGKQAVRKGFWKGIRLNVHKEGFHNNLELYNLEEDPAEMNNVAKQYPEIVEEIKSIMLKEHMFSEDFPFDFEEIKY